MESWMAGCMQGIETMHASARASFSTPFYLPHDQVVKQRNQLARLCGYEDFYDMKVTCRQ